MVEYIDRKDIISSDLVACKAAFDKAEVPWVIIGGIVLGYARYKDIMPWDTDLDICIFTEITNMQWNFVYTALHNQGFMFSNDRKDFIYANRETELNIDTYHKDGDFYSSFPKSTPGLKFVEKAEWFDDIQMVDFLGDKYPMPNNIEDFVSAHYGSDWKTNIMKDHEQYFIDKRGGRDQSTWTMCRSSKQGDLWPKILKVDEYMGVV